MRAASDYLPFLYVMRRADGVRKVGCSVDPQWRSKDLGYQYGTKFEVERVWGCKKGRIAERIAHKMLRPRLHPERGQREFYKASLEELSVVVERAIKKAYRQLLVSRPPRSIWMAGADLPIAWKMPIRRYCIDKRVSLRGIVIQAINEFAAREGIKLP